MKTINNNIEEQRVGFDNAKLLEEKGFKCKVEYYFVNRDQYGVQNKNKREVKYTDALTRGVKRPTQQLVIEWIRINFGIHIILDFTFYDGFHYGCKIMSPNGNVEEVWSEGVDNDVDGSDTPEEAKEAAISYVLTTLI